MTQPSFVPIAEADQVRPSLRLQVPGPWSTTRPAESAVPRQPQGRGFGSPGPDQGFALRLAHRAADRLRLSADESAEDVIVGVAMLASRRAGLTGRAPCVYDVETAIALFGFEGDAPADLIAERTRRFRSVAHDYAVQRDLVDSVPGPSLLLRADEVAARTSEWRALLGTDDRAE
jgi:hypothetical protein